MISNSIEGCSKLAKMKTYKFSELSLKVQSEVIKERIEVGHFKSDMTTEEASDYFKAWNTRFNKIGVVKMK